MLIESARKPKKESDKYMYQHFLLCIAINCSLIFFSDRTNDNHERIPGRRRQKHSELVNDKKSKQEK